MCVCVCVWNFVAKKALLNNSNFFIWRVAVLKKLKYEIEVFELGHTFFFMTYSDSESEIFYLSWGKFF